MTFPSEPAADEPLGVKVSFPSGASCGMRAVGVKIAHPLFLWSLASFNLMIASNSLMAGALGTSTRLGKGEGKVGRGSLITDKAHA